MCACEGKLGVGGGCGNQILGGLDRGDEVHRLTDPDRDDVRVIAGRRFAIPLLRRHIVAKFALPAPPDVQEPVAQRPGQIPVRPRRTAGDAIGCSTETIRVNVACNTMP